MSKKIEVQENSAEALVVNDSNLMEFLSTASVLFDISKKNWSKYMSTGSVSIDLENLHVEKKISQITSFDKLNQDMKEKEKKLRKLKKEKKELGVLLKETNESFTAFDKYRIDILKIIQSFSLRKNKMTSNRLKNELIMEDKGIEKFRSDYREYTNRLQHLKRKYKELEYKKIGSDYLEHKNREEIFSEIQSLENKIKHVDDKGRLYEGRRSLLKGKIEDLVHDKKKYFEDKRTHSKYVENIHKCENIKKQIQRKIVSNSRKIKLAQTAIKNLKEKLEKIQSIKIVKKEIAM